MARPAPGKLREGGSFVVGDYAYLLGLEGDAAAAIPYAEEAIARAMSDFGPDHQVTRVASARGGPSARDPERRDRVARQEEARPRRRRGAHRALHRPEPRREERVEAAVEHCRFTQRQELLAAPHPPGTAGSQQDRC